MQPVVRVTKSLVRSGCLRQFSIQCRSNGRDFIAHWKKNRGFVVLATRFCDHKTEPNIIHSKYKDIVLPNCTLGEYIWGNSEKWQDKTAMVCGVTDKSFTYAQGRKMCKALAACLRNKLGLRDGDCIAVMLPNSPEFPLACLGGLEAGCFITTINPIYTAEEIFRQIDNSNTKVIITTASNYSKVQNATNSLKINIPVIIADCDTRDPVPEGTIRFAEFAENFNEDTDCLKEVRRTGDDIAFLPYSSGTTGMPKGVELTHKNIIANCIQMQSTKVPIVQSTTETSQETSLCILPFFHIFGLVVTMMGRLADGMKLVTIPKFVPDTFLAAQEKYQASLMFVVPPIVLFLTQSKDVKSKHLDSLTTIMSGAAPLAKSDVERFLEKTKGKAAFTQGYGLTEASPMCMLQERGDLNYDSVGGLAASCSAMIVGLENKKTLGPNKVGELWVRGPNIMKGYFNNVKATEDTLKPGGWLRTGDLAYYDQNHYFYIKDRLKELIKVKGYQVPPAELEGILRSHPELLDAAVIGIPHPKYGEIPKAFVIKKSNMSPSPENIMSFVAEQVASYKKLGELQFVDTIPKNAAGKILRRELKDLYPYEEQKKHVIG